MLTRERVIPRQKRRLDTESHKQTRDRGELPS